MAGVDQTLVLHDLAVPTGEPAGASSVRSIITASREPLPSAIVITCPRVRWLTRSGARDASGSAPVVKTLFRIRDTPSIPI
jgi:hypothetical protein